MTNCYRKRNTPKMPPSFMADIRRVYEQAIGQATPDPEKQPQSAPESGTDVTQ